MNILTTGLSGLVGTTIKQMLPNYKFQDASYESNIDIRNSKQVESLVQSFKGEFVLHLAAKTDVDGCEGDRNNDFQLLNIQSQNNKQIPNSNFNVQEYKDWDTWKGINSAFSINVYGTHNIVHACRKYNKKLIHISTDFVFEGTKKEPYSEKDIPKPINHYAYTKYLAEQVVMQYNNHTIVRPAFPYGTTHPTRIDFVQALRQRFENKQEISGVVDQIFTPTYAPDIALAIDVIISNSLSGLYHAVGSESLSPFKAILAIAERFGYDKFQVKKAYSKEYYSGRAKRPDYLVVSNEKLKQEGGTFCTFSEGLQNIKQ